MSALWYEDESTKARLRAEPSRQRWSESGAITHFELVSPRLPENLRNRSRIGPLCIAPMDEDQQDTYCWMYPVDGSKFQGVMLGVANIVKLIDSEGKIYFEGRWGETTLELIESRERFYVWVEPIERKAPRVFSIK